MHVTVFGASGKVGRLVVQELSSRGHTVTAFVHRHAPFEESNQLRIARGDVHEATDVAAAIEGSQAVISAVSSWGTPGKDTLSAAMANICPAMKSDGIRRIISLTGADARADGDKLSAIHRMTHVMIGLIGAKVLADGEKHIEILRASGLDYTIIRSPIMRDNPSKSYRFGDRRPMPWSFVNYAAVAAAMADQLEADGTGGSCPYIIGA